MQAVTNKTYDDYLKQKCPSSRHARMLFFAFIIGGLICSIGECFRQIFIASGIKDPEKLGNIVSSIMIFLGALLTGLGFYDQIGNFAGCGSVVPITGFANSIVSPAIEYRTEGIIFGVESKMFIIAGPVIVSGVAASSLVGLIYYLIEVL